MMRYLFAIVRREILNVHEMAGGIECLFVPLGIDEGYRFAQTDDQVTVTFSLPDGIDLSSLALRYNPSDRSIYVGFPGQLPIICGLLFAEASEPQLDQSAGGRLIIAKATAEAWDCLISAPSSDGIDAKSVFILGLRDALNGNCREALVKFQRSAEMGYIHAKLFIASILLGAENTFGHDMSEYGLEGNAVEAAQLLQSIPTDRITAPIRIQLSHLLFTSGSIAEARQVLVDAVEESPAVRLALANLLSQWPEQTPEVQKEMVAHLEVLALQNEPRAIHWLARCYAEGRGIKKDARRARKLADQARALDPTLPNPVEEQGLSRTAVAAVAGVIALGVGIWWARSRRR
jgi:hypothetical protein